MESKKKIGSDEPTGRTEIKTQTNLAFKSALPKAVRELRAFQGMS